jgi:hypothetical protein
MKQEELARVQMDKDWTKYPAKDRDECINPKQYSPSYVEWLTCLEIRRDVRNLPKQ